jgi:hypothetical protein
VGAAAALEAEAFEAVPTEELAALAAPELLALLTADAPVVGLVLP